MIAQASTAGSIDGLANYLSYGKKENNNWVEDRRKRVAWESGRNLYRAKSIEEAKSHFKRTASRKGRRVEKPYYLVIVSWQSGNEEKGIPPDDPGREEMEWAVDEALSELGLEEHQAWIVAHRDTDTPHVHVAVCRIHPRTGETWNPSYDQTTLYHALREIEEQKGWHRPGPMRIEDLSSDEQRGLEYWEEQAEKFGRERSVRRWAREEGLLDDLLEATSWSEAEEAAEKRGASLEPRRENGMVLERGGRHVALSSIDPKISRPRLEKRFGQTWEEYRQGADRQKAGRPEETPGGETPEAPAAEPDDKQRQPGTQRRQVSFKQEVRIRAAPALLESESREELQRRLAPHGLFVEDTYSTFDPYEKPVPVVSNGTDQAPLSEVMPGDSEARLSGRFALKETYRKKAASVRESRSGSETTGHRERALREDIFQVHHWYGVPEEDVYGEGTGSAQALLRVNPEVRKQVFRDFVEAAATYDLEELEERVSVFEEKVLKESRLRASLSERQREVLRRTDRSALTDDWRAPVGTGDADTGDDFSREKHFREKTRGEPGESSPTEQYPPVEQYRRLSEEAQAELKERMTDEARKKLMRQVREERREEMGPARDQIAGNLEEDRWREASDTYLIQSEMNRRDLRQMLSGEMCNRLQDATARRENEFKEARQAYERLSHRAQKAFKKVRGYLKEGAEAPGKEGKQEALAGVVRAWKEVGPELTEEDQQMLLLGNPSRSIKEETADKIIREARRLRAENRQEADRQEDRQEEDRQEDRDRNQGSKSKGIQR